jgi:hypothetical protein
MSPVFYLVASDQFVDPKGGGVNRSPDGEAPTIVSGLKPMDYHVGVGVPFPPHKSEGPVSMVIPGGDTGGLTYDGWIASSGAAVGGWLYLVRWYPVQVKRGKTALVSLVLLPTGKDVNARLSELAPQEPKYRVALGAEGDSNVLGIPLSKAPVLLERIGLFFETTGRSTGRVWLLLDTETGTVTGRQRFENESGDHTITPITGLGTPELAVSRIPVSKRPPSSRESVVEATASGSNQLTLINSSGEPALVKIEGPTATTIDAPADAQRRVLLLPGDYFIKIRYGTSGKYRFERGANFTVTQTASTGSHVQITLHKVVGGNYNSWPISSADFDK